MMERVGISRISELYEDVPASLLRAGPPELPEALSEWEAVRTARDLAERNTPAVSFAGAGIYDHHIPAAVDHLSRRSEFYTAYTPYQAEVSQGTLQVIYEFQTMVCELTGMEVANASVYDGATATAEAALMALGVTGRDRIVLSETLHPAYRAVTGTYVSGTAREVARLQAGEDGRLEPQAAAGLLDEDTACLVVQSPNFFGLIEELEPLAEAAHECGALLVVSVADPIPLALLRSPGEAGADIVAGEGQPFGNAPSFGGPALGLFASRRKFIRQMPGRIAGATVDGEGMPGYVLTLQTREQQIRREKATSNICTNQGLNALAATLYLAAVGRDGLRRVAEASVQHAHYARERIAGLPGVELLWPESPVAREFAVATREDPELILRRGLDRGIVAGVSLARFPELGAPDGLLLAFTEKRSRREMDTLLEVLESR